MKFVKFGVVPGVSGRGAEGVTVIKGKIGDSIVTMEIGAEC